METAVRMAASPRNLFSFYAAGLLALAVYGALVWKVSAVPGSAWVMGAVFLAALVSSVAGFAFSAICGAMLFHFVKEPLAAVQIMIVCSVGGQAMMVWSLRREVDWPALRVFLLGGLLGLQFGLFVLLNSRPALYLQIIGGLLMVYAAYMGLRRPAVVRDQRPVWDGIAGFLGGIAGGVAAFPGATVTIWCGLKGWSKERQRGVYQPFILILQISAIAILALLGDGHGRTAAFDFSGLIYLPAMLLGASLGMTFFKWLDDRQFAWAVNALLMASGLGLLL